MSFKVGDVIKLTDSSFYRLVIAVYGYENRSLDVENLDDGCIQEGVNSGQYELVNDIELLRKFYD